SPLARQESPVSKSNVPRRNSHPIRMMAEETAWHLQSATRDTVQRGTAKSIAKTLEDAGWQIGGKTGSGPAMLPKGDLVDGWFEGLIFDTQGKSDLTIAELDRSARY